MVAHHILSWEDFPELRNELANGITLCNPCHFREHGWSISQAGIQKLIDDRGIEQRRWVGSCLWCDSFLVKQASDLRRADGTYRTYGFCNKECAMQASGSIRKGMTKADIKGLKVSDIFEQWAEDKINNGTSFKQKK